MFQCGFFSQGNGTTSSNLTIYNVSPSDEGSYTCRVDNAHGIDEESAQLLVQGQFRNSIIIFLY